MVSASPPRAEQVAPEFPKRLRKDDILGAARSRRAAGGFAAVFAIGGVIVLGHRSPLGLASAGANGARTDRPRSDRPRSDRPRSDGPGTQRADAGGTDIAAWVDVHVDVVVVLALVGFPVEIHSGAAAVIS